MARLNPYATADYPAPTRLLGEPVAPSPGSEPPASSPAGDKSPDGVRAGPNRSPRPTPYDPLRLCVFATIAALGWAFGPFALMFFAGLGLLGYSRARRVGSARRPGQGRGAVVAMGYLGLLGIAGLTGAVLAALRLSA